MDIFTVVPGAFFGEWEVLEETTPLVFGGISYRRALCKCKCGTTKLVLLKHLKSGASSGCRECSNSRRVLTYKGRFIVGQQYKNFMLLSFNGDKIRSKSTANIRCVCGAEKTVCYATLVAWENKSKQGCLCAEGLYKLPEYLIWGALKQRHPHRVCPEWVNSFAKFYADMGERPGAKFRLMCKDASKPFDKENCHWAPVAFPNFRGKTIREAAAALGTDVSVIYCRLRSGWPEEKAFSTPVRQLHSRRSDIKKVAALLGVHPNTIYKRLSFGWSKEKAFTTPNGKAS